MPSTLRNLITRWSAGSIGVRPSAPKRCRFLARTLLDEVLARFEVHLVGVDAGPAEVSALTRCGR